MALVLFPAVRAAGIHLRFIVSWRHPAVREAVRLSGWTVGYVIANQIALAFVLVIATSEKGVVSAYTYAYAFFQLPHGLFAVSIMTTLGPELASLARRGDTAASARPLLARPAQPASSSSRPRPSATSCCRARSSSA